MQDTQAAALERTVSEREDRHSPSQSASDDGEVPLKVEESGGISGATGKDDDGLQPHLTTTKSYATGTSAASGQAPTEEPVKRSWISKINPLRWGPVPPIPEEKAVSKEHGAGWWGKLTFSWMAPLMTVSSNKHIPSNVFVAAFTRRYCCTSDGGCLSARMCRTTHHCTWMRNNTS
mgnify:CR=1 FL=1